MSLRSILRSSLCALPLAAGALPPPAHAQSTVRAGTEFRVSEYATGDQRLPAAVAAPDGTYFIVWESQFQDGDSFGIFGRFLSRQGVPLGPEFQINQATASDQKQPALTVDASGRFTVAWTGQDVAGGGVFARQYTAAGPLGPEFQVNVFTTGDQFRPKVSAGPGGVAVVWQSDGQDGNLMGVFGRLLSPTGTPISGEFQLSTTVARNQTQPVVAALDTGRYGVAWLSEPATGSAPLVFSRLFDLTGAPVNGEQLIGAADSFFQIRRDHLSAVPAPSGGYVISWWQASTMFGKFGAISFDSGAAMVTHDAAGAPVTAQFAGGSGEGSRAHWEIALGMNFTGRRLVAYTSTPGVLPCVHIPPDPSYCQASGTEDGSASGVFALPFGSPDLPGRVQVNTFTSGDQTRPAVAADPYGNSLVAWQSAGQDGSGFGVYAQRFGGFFAGALEVDPSGNGVLDPGTTEAVRPSWLNVSGAAQTFGGTAFGFVGPAGATYTVNDGTASYGTVPGGASQACTDCYAVTLSIPGARPFLHFDSFLGESLTPGEFSVHRPWTVHVGGSFTDVSSASPFYRFVETLLHNGITSGCGGGSYCPASATSRDQMSVFVHGRRSLLERSGRRLACPNWTLSRGAGPDSYGHQWRPGPRFRGYDRRCHIQFLCPWPPLVHRFVHHRKRLLHSSRSANRSTGGRQSGGNCRLKPVAERRRRRLCKPERRHAGAVV
jgi:hypothetical protein